GGRDFGFQGGRPGGASHAERDGRYAPEDDVVVRCASRRANALALYLRTVWRADLTVTPAPTNFAALDEADSQLDDPGRRPDGDHCCVGRYRTVERNRRHRESLRR